MLDKAKTCVIFALTPPNLTEVTPTKPLPAIVTNVPGFPLAGLKLAITGRGTGVGFRAAVTVKAIALVAFPSFPVETVIGPVVAPAGTVVVISVAVFVASGLPVSGPERSRR